jgi:L-2-hydroxyglutarate oxidase
VYDFDIRTNKNLIHICNAPSPAATSSLAVGETIAKKALSFLE